MTSGQSFCICHGVRRHIIQGTSTLRDLPFVDRGFEPLAVGEAALVGGGMTVSGTRTSVSVGCASETSRSVAVWGSTDRASSSTTMSAVESAVSTRGEGMFSGSTATSACGDASLISTSTSATGGDGVTGASVAGPDFDKEETKSSDDCTASVIVAGVGETGSTRAAG